VAPTMGPAAEGPEGAPAPGPSGFGNATVGYGNPGDSAVGLGPTSGFSGVHGRHRHGNDRGARIRCARHHRAGPRSGRHRRASRGGGASGTSGPECAQRPRRDDRHAGRHRPLRRGYRADRRRHDRWHYRTRP
jgi:hypothetical protein